MKAKRVNENRDYLIPPPGRPLEGCTIKAKKAFRMDWKRNA